jgi:ribosomal protein S18 acetylase RimI-like enzyme
VVVELASRSVVDPSSAPAGLLFSRGGPRDVPAVVGLVESAYRGEASRQGWTTEADYLDGQRTDEAAVSALVAQPSTRLLVARRYGEVVGCCALALEGGRRVRLSMLAVSPRHQAEGIGRAILDEAAATAASELGATGLELAVLSPRRELLAWYGRRGYTPTGRREPFPYGDARFGLPRRDDLFFVILERPLRPEEAPAVRDVDWPAG